MTRPPHPQQAIAPLLAAAFGAQSAQVLYVAAKLGLADGLRDGPLGAEALAGALGADAPALERLLRGLVNLGVCKELAGARFALTPLGEHLRADHPDSVQARVILNAEVHHALWGDLLTTLRSGESASERVYGAPFYEHLARDPAAGALFDRAMSAAGWVRHRIRPTVEAYDFGRFTSIVDVGGGNGTLMAEILKAHARPSGTVFDVPRLAEAARRTIESAGLGARCRFVAGNAFEEVPTGGDAYLLSNFANSFGDQEVAAVLCNTRKAVPANGRLLVIDWIMPAAGEPRDDFRYWDTVTMDLIMLAAFGSRSGRIRTRAEFEALLDAAGFSLANVIATRASVSVLEAAPA